MLDGWCPFALPHLSGPFGYPAGTRGQNRPLFFVDHRMAGFKRTLDDDAWRAANGVGVHFGIGLDGAISQYASIFDASWGNGVTGSVERYDRRNRHLAAIEALGSWRAAVAGGVRQRHQLTLDLDRARGRRPGGHRLAACDARG